MAQVNNSSVVRWRVYSANTKYTGKRTRTQAVEVTEKNVEAIRKLWKKPQAEVGDYLTKSGDFPKQVYTILKPEVFHMRWESL